MVRSVLAYAENRLRMNPVPLDKGTLPADELYERLDGVIRDTPRPPDEVLGVYTSVIAPSVISADSPRFLGFIPAAPTKASLLFDMLVSCASIQGISWLEASGAIAAENSVLRVIANEAGLPTTSGGCFVSGGSAGNLSALAVARETAKNRGRHRPAARGRRHRCALVDRQHAAAAGDGRARGRHPGPPAHRRHRPRRRAAPMLPNIAAVVCTSGTTNAGIIDDLAGVGALARERGWWFHVDGAYGGSGIFARSLRPKYDGHRAGRLVHPRPAQVAVHPVRLLRAAVPRARAGPGHAHPGRVVPRRHPHLRRRVEPDRLRLPPDPAGPRAAAVVLAGGLRAGGVPRGHRGRRVAGTSRPRS